MPPCRNRYAVWRSADGGNSAGFLPLQLTLLQCLYGWVLRSASLPTFHCEELYRAVNERSCSDRRIWIYWERWWDILCTDMVSTFPSVWQPKRLEVADRVGFYFPGLRLVEVQKTGHEGLYRAVHLLLERRLSLLSVRDLC